MKATHTGRVADLEHVVRSSDPSMQFTAHQMCFMLDYEDKEIELFKESDRWYTEVNTNFIFINHMLTDLKEIKPHIEIPETPFWIDDGDELRKIVDCDLVWYLGHYQYGNSTFRVCISMVKDNLNNGTWTICEEPKKEMRAWGYEDFDKIWSNGITVKYHEALILATRLNLRGLIIDGEMIEFQDLDSEGYTDRHGNKFEKEV